MWFAGEYGDLLLRPCPPLPAEEGVEGEEGVDGSAAEWVQPVLKDDDVDNKTVGWVGFSWVGLGFCPECLCFLLVGLPGLAEFFQQTVLKVVQRKEVVKRGRSLNAKVNVNVLVLFLSRFLDKKNIFT